MIKQANLGFAKRGVIFIPELMQMGQQEVFYLLNDQFYISEFSSNPVQYYYVITSLCIQEGMDLAVKWHEDFSSLKSYIGNLRDEGPADDAYALVNKLLKLNKDGFNALCGEVFDECLSQHDSYWKMQDPRPYTFSALMAAYQLGISLVLEKLGY